MLKRDLTFIDFDGNEKTKTHYFNLTKVEIVELELASMEIADDGKTIRGTGFIERIQAIAKAGKGKEIMGVFKDLILASYGERSEDGEAFLKEDGALTKKFAGTQAYSTLFVELVTNSTAAADFLNAVIPSDLSKEIAAQATRADGRPPIQDHLPKRTAFIEPEKKPNVVTLISEADKARTRHDDTFVTAPDAPQELRTVDEPALGYPKAITQEDVNTVARSLNDRAEAGTTLPPVPTGPVIDENSASYKDYQNWLAQQAPVDNQG